MFTALSRAVVGTLTLLSLAFLLACGGPKEVGFNGTILSSAQEAADFSLTDQFGNPDSISDHRGDVVLLTFLYTQCIDICPALANQLSDVYRWFSGLEETKGAVSIMIVSVDPDGDSIQQVYDYSERHGMLDGWSYLVGDHGELSEVWADYYVSPTPSKDYREYEDGSTDWLAEEIASAYAVNHQTPIYLIDIDGRMRVLFTQPFVIGDVIADMITLLNENPHK